jgi:hypothetical protein
VLFKTWLFQVLHNKKQAYHYSGIGTEISVYIQMYFEKIVALNFTKKKKKVTDFSLS